MGEGIHESWKNPFARFFIFVWDKIRRAFCSRARLDRILEKQDG